MVDLAKLKYDEKGLIPCIVQDYTDNEVLMMAYMNEESLKMSIEKKQTVYFSRSRNELWHKGATSGHYQNIKEIYYDCDADTLLIKVEQVGGIACHTGKKSCFFNKLEEFEKVDSADLINSLYDLIKGRKENPVEGSYTNYLFEKGIDKILKKVGEENAEVIIGSKNGDKSEVIYEVADLTYHILVLLAELEITPNEIRTELEKRKK